MRPPASSPATRRTPSLRLPNCPIRRTRCSIPGPRISMTKSCSWHASRICVGSRPLHVARSRDGLDGWVFDDEPLMSPHPDHPEEIWGCEDPRLTWLEDEQEWSIAYTAYSRGARSCARHDDRFPLRPTARAGDATRGQGRRLFPRRFGGRWAMIHRPTPLRGGANLAVVFSRPASLGRSLAHAGSPGGRLVGCRQDRPGAPRC